MFVEAILLIIILVVYITLRWVTRREYGGSYEDPHLVIMNKILSEINELGELIKAASTLEWLDEVPAELELPRPIPGSNATLQDEHLKRLLVDLHFATIAPAGPILYFAGDDPNAHVVAEITAELTARELIVVYPRAKQHNKKYVIEPPPGTEKLPAIYHTDWFTPREWFIARETAPFSHAGRKLIAPFASREGEVYTTNFPAQDINHIHKLDYYNYIYRPYGYHKINARVPFGVDHCGDCAQLCRAFEAYPQLLEKFDKIKARLHIQLWEPNGHGNYITMFKSPSQIKSMQSIYAKKHIVDYITKMEPIKLTNEIANMYKMAVNIIIALNIPLIVKNSLLNHLPNFLLFPIRDQYCVSILKMICYNDYSLVETLCVLLVRLFSINKDVKIKQITTEIPKCYTFVNAEYPQHSLFIIPGNNRPVLFDTAFDNYLPEKYELWTPCALININSPRVNSRKYFLFDCLPEICGKYPVVLLLINISSILSILIENHFARLGKKFYIINDVNVLQNSNDIVKHIKINSTFMGSYNCIATLGFFNILEFVLS